MFGKSLITLYFLTIKNYQIYTILYISLKPPLSAPNRRYFLHKLHLVNYIYFCSLFLWKTPFRFVYTHDRKNSKKNFIFSKIHSTRSYIIGNTLKGAKIMKFSVKYKSTEKSTELDISVEGGTNPKGSSEKKHTILEKFVQYIPTAYYSLKLMDLLMHLLSVTHWPF